MNRAGSRASQHSTYISENEDKRSDWTFILGVVMVVCALLLMWNCGQMCQKAKNDGMAYATANAKVTADQQAYDRGYADAVWDYEHPGEYTCAGASGA